MNFNILSKINGPKDVKKLNFNELKELASDIREALLTKVSTAGGHFGPNLGMVEATIAMHYVFNSPQDKIVYDVSHQSYPHKMLTGRKNAFINPDEYGSTTGYTSQDESEHDFFTIGHTSTSISLACGLAKARDVKGEKGNVIAVIGDGSLSGGEAYEGLNNAAESKKNIIILVNDNDMSIGENHGGLYENLRLLRETKGKAENNLFKALGLDYVYVENGHDIKALIETFKKVKDIDHPIVVHMYTIKGNGYSHAVENKEAFHWTMPFDLKTGKVKGDFSAETYQTVLGNFLVESARADKTVVGITAGTPSFLGGGVLRTPEFKDQYVDVGIAEEHAIALASGMASQGAKPVVSLFSAFIQRTYDQLSHDLALNNNPALISVVGGGISDMGKTHIGIFDIPLISSIPNIKYLAPATKEEYVAMLNWGLNQQEQPVAVRMPNGPVVSTGEEVEADFSKVAYKKVSEGSKVAILGLGHFLKLGEDVKALLKEKMGIDATLINPRFITGLDEEMLNGLLKDHELVVTLEDGSLDGGFGEKIDRFYAGKDMKVLNCGATKEFTDVTLSKDLYVRYHLTKELIVEDIKNILK